MYFNFCILIA